jgi:hypothetical protein
MRLGPSAAQNQIAKGSTWLLPHTCTRLEPSATLTLVPKGNTQAPTLHTGALTSVTPNARALPGVKICHNLPGLRSIKKSKQRCSM